MRIEVVGRNVEVTDPIRQHAEAKAAKLPRFYDGIQQITFRLSREDHHKHGEFGAELVVDVRRHEDFISRANDRDLYAAIDAVVAKSQRQLADFKEQLKLGKR